MLTVEVFGKLDLFERDKLEKRLTSDIRQLGLFLESEHSSLDVHVLESCSHRITAKVSIYVYSCHRTQAEPEDEIWMLGTTTLFSVKSFCEESRVEFESVNVIVSDFRSGSLSTIVVSV